MPREGQNNGNAKKLLDFLRAGNDRPFFVQQPSSRAGEVDFPKATTKIYHTLALDYLSLPFYLF